MGLTGAHVVFASSIYSEPDEDGVFWIPKGAASFNVTQDDAAMGAMTSFF
jgi:hypothetical protein